jgi:heptosyltransferase I
MLTPLVRMLQDSLPQAQITWIIAEPAYQVVATLENVNFIVIKKPKSLADYWRFYKLMQAQSFDVLLATQASLRANLLYPLIKAKWKLGYDKRRARDGQAFFVNEQISAGNDHTLEGFLKFGLSLGLNTNKIRWDIPIKEEDQNFAIKTLEPFKGRTLVVINPLASKPERSWLLERYIEVILYLQKTYNAAVILTGGPALADKEFTTAIAAQTQVLNVAGKTKPPQLLALIAAADLAIMPDTGPAHMAAAVNTKVISLHAVTNPAISCPYGFADLCVNFYPAAVQTILKQDINTLPWGTQVHNMKAMSLITVDAVIAKITEVFSE